jgi:hypothetical protein
VITHEAIHASTVYRLHVIDEPVMETWDITVNWTRYILAETGWERGHGEWITLSEDSIAWSYIAEKMPQLAQRIGDRPGWVKAFALAGVEVFGW